MLKTFAFAALFAVAAVSAPAYAGIQLNGLALNGVNLNGLNLNGLALNGVNLNGVNLNGLVLNGLMTSSGSLQPERLTLPDGTVLTF
jgi:uncharacterized protein YjbI with pentapeptide repeats